MMVLFLNYFLLRIAKNDFLSFKKLDGLKFSDSSDFFRFEWNLAARTM